MPLSSLRSGVDSGIGEIPDLVPFVRFLASAGQSVLALLPLGESSPGEASPYSALSSFALDPLYVRVGDLPELGRVDPSASKAPRDRVDRVAVWEWKRPLLEAAHERFLALSTDHERRRSFVDFLQAEKDWLEEYALFRAIREENDERWWRDWPAPLRDRNPRSLAAARKRLAPRIAFFEYLQFVATTQWMRAREHARRQGVLLLGDLPFAPGQDSADVWAHPDLFDHGRATGAPPDAFSAEGQRWGLPAYRWSAHRASGWAWFRRRVRRLASLYDLFRVDHVVGLFRTWTYVAKEPGVFDPAEEKAQIAQGREILSMMIEAGKGALPVAEDLGVIPDWVRTTLGSLDVPGFKIFRWELVNEVVVDPMDYPECALATTGTHDTDTLVEWWATTDAKTRERVATLAGAEGEKTAPSLPASVRRGIVSRLYASKARYVIVPIQDLYGWKERINLPGTVGTANWSWRMKETAEELEKGAFAAETAALKQAARKTGRA